jgi:hypothetical protein
MFFNENEVRHLVDTRKQEIASIAANAWKLHELEQESFFQKIVRKWKSRRETIVVQPNCSCACHS